MAENHDRVYVRPRRDYFVVARPGRRRGLAFTEREDAIRHARRLAPRVFLLNATGKIERELPSPVRIPALLAEHRAMLADGVHEDRDSRWRIVERFADGSSKGWFVEHDGSLYNRLENGEDGPAPSYEGAENLLARHLWLAIHEMPEGRMLTS
jgi:hypothetical protein